MADTEKGGLSSINPTASFAQKLQAQTAESQQILDAHRKRLMDLISSRQQMPFDPAMMGLAAGLLAPTKTGGFGESLGYGMSNYAAEAEKQFRRQQEEAKLAYELEVGAQQQKRELMGQQLMAEMFGAEDLEAPPVAKVAKAEVPPVPPPAAPPPAKVDVAAPAEAPAAVPAEAPAEAAKVAEVQTIEAAKALDMPELALPAVPRNKIARMTDEQIAMLKTFNPAMGKILEEYRKAFRENRDIQIKEVDLQRRLQELQLAQRKDVREETKLSLEKKESGFKEREVEAKEQSVERNLPGVGNIKMPMNFWKEVNEAQKSGDFAKLLDVYKSNNMPVNTIVGSDGRLRFMTPSELEIKVKKDEARFTQTPIKVQIPEYGVGTFDMTPVEYSDYEAARRSGNPDVLQHWFNGSKFQGVVIPGSTIGTKFNSPELTNPKPAAKAPAEAPAEAPADKAVVPKAVTTAEPKADSSVAAARTTTARVPTGRVLSAEELERQRKEEELERNLRQQKAEQQVITQETGPRKRSEEETKADVELGTNIMKEGTNAQNIRIIAKDLRSIATSNPKILDVMQDTTVSDALARTIQSGIITPWGSVSIDPKDLYVAVDNFASKKPGVTKADRDAYSLFLRNIAQLTILERRMSRGEGAISDKETGLFQQVNVLPSDSALAVRLKAELIEERANVTEKVGDAFYKYKKKTNGSYEDFTHSDEYKAIKKGYEDKLDRIRDSNAKLLGGVSTQSQTTPQTTLPPAALKQLAEGQVTRFANGQEWTLRGGKPIRIK